MAFVVHSSVESDVRRRLSKAAASRPTTLRLPPLSSADETWYPFPMRTFSRQRLDDLLEQAARRPRRRLNLNLHPELTDPVQRLFNAIAPGSYVRPHRHDPSRWELFVVFSGRAVVLSFDDDGIVTGRAELSPDGPELAVEIAGGVGHTVAALGEETLLLEVKPGPYHALSDKDFAPWAPAEDEPASATLERRYRTAQVGERLTA